MEYNILVINPGSTSDQISYFKGEKEIFHKTVRYSPEDLKQFEHKRSTDQFEFRKTLILKTIEENHVDMKEVDAFIGLCGLVKPVESGVYEVNEGVIRDLRAGVSGDHPINLAGILADYFAKQTGAKAFVADPPVADEMEFFTKYSGMPENPRTPLFHPLNQKRVARHAAAAVGKPYEECNFIIMHAGGGVSVGAHKNGRVVDINNALDGEGPFTPQRSGTVPVGPLVRLCYSGKYTFQEMYQKVRGKGGLIAYTGTSDCAAIEDYIATGNVKPGSGLDPKKVSREEAKNVLVAMAYKMSREICALGAMFAGEPIDAVILTGGLAHSKFLMDEVKRRTSWMADQVLVYPGGDEMTALRVQAERALNNPKIVKEYK